MPPLLKVECGFDRIHCIEELPSEELCDLLALLAVTDYFHDILVWLSSDMSVSGSRLVDRFLQLEFLYDLCRTEVEQLGNLGCYFLIGDLVPVLVLFRCAVGICKDADRAGDPDSICHLHEKLVGNSCGYKVLGNISGCIGCGTVDL